ncbi:MAG: hypothetical protein IKM28_09305 [Lachnospiraceae bacterium]|nr:hypothetical protein [Lachnospiraceae bacterium]
MVDDTITSQTKPSSQNLHSIEDAYFHQSYLKGKQDDGHQAVAALLSCNGIVLNYTFVQNIAEELPVPPIMSYFLCDCWYVSEKIIHAFAAKGFHPIGALKTNRLLFPFGIRKNSVSLPHFYRYHVPVFAG